MAAKARVDGTWNLHEILQYQSEDSSAHGEHPDGEHREDPRGGEYEGCTLDLAVDGTWSLVVGGEMRARGTWTMKKSKLELAEDGSVASGYARLSYARADKNVLAVAFELVPDAHDGLDVLELSFRREPLPVRLDARNGLRLISQGLTDAQRDDLNCLEGEALRELVGAAWDGWLAGTLKADPESQAFYDERGLLERTTDELVTAGAFRHEHALHALRTLDEEGLHNLGGVLVNAIAALPATPGADAEIAKALTPVWLERFASYRSYCNLPEAVWSSGRFPTPALDDLCRDMFLAPGFMFSNRALIGSLFYEPMLCARAAVHLKNVIWATVGDAVQAHPAVAREEALSFLKMSPEERRKIQGANTAWSNAQFFAVLCREDPATLPPLVCDALDQKVTSRDYGFDPAAKAYARASIDALPETLRIKAAQALWL